MVRNRIRKFYDFFMHSILHVDDTPHRIALGAAVGIFVAWTPTFGVQMVIGVALAALLRANKAAVIPMVWITNPLTNVPIYGTGYFLGHFLTTGNVKTNPEVNRQLIRLLKEIMLLDIWEADFWARLYQISYQVGFELWVGSIVLGLVSAVITYPVILGMVMEYRKLKEEHFKKKAHSDTVSIHQPDPVSPDDQHHAA